MFIHHAFIMAYAIINIMLPIKLNPTALVNTQNY